MPVVEKEKARPAKTRPQSPPAKAETADTNSIPLSGEDKKVLRSIGRAVGKTLGHHWKVKDALAGDDLPALTKHARLLRAASHRAFRASSALLATLARHKKEAR